MKQKMAYGTNMIIKRIFLTALFLACSLYVSLIPESLKIFGHSPLKSSSAFAQETLKGYVERAAEPLSDKLQGEIVDARTGVPIPDAQVSLPDQGFLMKTGKNGEYRIPRYMGKNPIIMSVEKEGYLPFSISITEHSPPRFSIRLQKLVDSLLLDTQLRHLGDGSFSPQSSNAFDFKKLPDGPALRIQFSMDGSKLSESPYLQIGSIIGLDTAMVHYLTGNLMDVYASPLLIKLNGTIIARVQVNGDNHKILLPKELIRIGSLNSLEIESGYHYPEPGRLDYDDMELIHLVVHP